MRHLPSSEDRPVFGQGHRFRRTSMSRLSHTAVLAPAQGYAPANSSVFQSSVSIGHLLSFDVAIWKNSRAHELVDQIFCKQREPTKRTFSNNDVSSCCSWPLPDCATTAVVFTAAWSQIQPQSPKLLDAGNVVAQHLRESTVARNRNNRVLKSV